MSYLTLLMRLEALRALPEPCLREVDQYAQPEPRAQRAFGRALQQVNTFHAEVERARRELVAAPNTKARYQIFRHLPECAQVNLWANELRDLSEEDEYAFRKRVSKDDDLYATMEIQKELYGLDDDASSNDDDSGDDDTSSGDDDASISGMEGIRRRVRDDVVQAAVIEYLCSLCPLQYRPFPQAHDVNGWKTLLGEKALT